MGIGDVIERFALLVLECLHGTYRVGECAALLNVNPRTMRRWMYRGLVDYLRLPGGERRIPRDELLTIFGHSTESSGVSNGGPKRSR